MRRTLSAGELELQTSLADDGAPTLAVRYAGAAEWYHLPGEDHRLHDPVTTTPCSAFWSTSCNDLLPPDQHHAPACQSRSGAPEIPGPE